MTTIRRHPVPTDSWDPERPLNDLMIEQLNHFTYVVQRLPAEARAALPPAPKADDSVAAHRFIAAVTKALMSGKRAPGPQLVARARRREPGVIGSLAAQADTVDASAEGEDTEGQEAEIVLVPADEPGSPS